MKLAWVTDAHFNLVDTYDIPFLIKDFEEAGDAVLYTGDLADGNLFKLVLDKIGAGTKPAFYITGNHDYYHSSWDVIDRLCRTSTSKAISLEYNSPVKLTENSVLVGTGGWADGRAGDFIRSAVGIADHFAIRELAPYDGNSPQILKLVQARADQQQEVLRKQIEEALKLHPKVIYIASHVPIFTETNLAPNRLPSDKNWLPHFAWVGPRAMIVDFAAANPDVEFVSLAGHTHTSAEYQATPNLRAKVAGARYEQPKVAQVIEVE